MGSFKKYFTVHTVFWIIIAVAIAIDQAVKHLVVSNMHLGQRLILIPNFLSAYFTYNTGAGFSLLWGMNSILIWTAIIIIGVIIYFYDKITENWYYTVAFALIIGGAVGNVIDRILLGHVTDYISFYIIFDYFPSFNLADSCITVGAVIILIYTIFMSEKKEDKKKEANKEETNKEEKEEAQKKETKEAKKEEILKQDKKKSKKN